LEGLFFQQHHIRFTGYTALSFRTVVSWIFL